MSLTDYNTSGGNTVAWRVNNDGFNYLKLRELAENEEYPLYGCFISKDHGFGEGAVLITDGYNVNIPQRYVDTIRDIIGDAVAIAQINSGKATFHYETFNSQKYHTNGYRLVFTVK